MKTVKKTIIVTEGQDLMLKRLSEVSLKSQAVLIREAIDLLFKAQKPDLTYGDVNIPKIDLKGVK